MATKGTAETAELEMSAMTSKTNVATRNAFTPAMLTGPVALSARQQQIAALAAHGLTNKDIARQLGLAEGTIKLQMHHILRKLGMKRRGELILRGISRSWR
jgi:DNA-binding NarL/FixJ family response regulator